MVADLVKNGLLDLGLPTTFRNTNPVLYNPTRTRSSFLNHLAVGLIHDALQLMSGCCSAKPDKNPSTLTKNFCRTPACPGSGDGIRRLCTHRVATFFIDSFMQVHLLNYVTIIPKTIQLVKNFF